MKTIDQRLIGKWVIDQDDPAVLKQMGNVTIIFDSENIMRYITLDKGSIHITSLTYRVEGNIIFSTLPPELSEEKTKYSFENDTILELVSDGLKSRFFKTME